MVGDEVILAKEWIKYKKRYFSNMEQGCFRRSSKSASLFRAMRILIYAGFVICVIPLLFMILESVFGWWGWDDSRLTSIYPCVILAWLAIFIVMYVIASRVGVFLEGADERRGHTSIVMWCFLEGKGVATERQVGLLLEMLSSAYAEERESADRARILVWTVAIVGPISFFAGSFVDPVIREGFNGALLGQSLSVVLAVSIALMLLELACGVFLNTLIYGGLPTRMFYLGVLLKDLRLARVSGLRFDTGRIESAEERAFS